MSFYATSLVLTLAGVVGAALAIALIVAVPAALRFVGFGALAEGLMASARAAIRTPPASAKAAWVVCALGAPAVASDVVNCAPGPGALCVEKNLEAAHLAGADLGMADFFRSNLRGANLRNADLDGTRLDRADLTGAVLVSADLTEADLRGADLRNARLTNANLIDADLRNARLDGADLRGANLTGARLANASLRGADLRRALFDAAEFRSADTDDCVGCPALSEIIERPK